MLLRYATCAGGFSILSMATWLYPMVARNSRASRFVGPGKQFAITSDIWRVRIAIFFWCCCGTDSFVVFVISLRERENTGAVEIQRIEKGKARISPCLAFFVLRLALR